jgi:ABC-type sulfate transport system substrate-binding protein
MKQSSLSESKISITDKILKEKTPKVQTKEDINYLYSKSRQRTTVYNITRIRNNWKHTYIYLDELGELPKNKLYLTT